jgi:hypothetical protein
VLLSGPNSFPCHTFPLAENTSTIKGCTLTGL